MIGYKKEKNSAQSGFTILEMVVVVGIFSIVLIMIAGMLTQFTSLQRRSMAEQTLQSDLRFAIELFNREVRTGYGSTYGLPLNPHQSGDRNGNSVVFRNQSGNCVYYRLNSQGIERAEADVTQDCRQLNWQSQNPRFFTLTKNQTEIDIANSRFFPVAARVSDDGQLQSQGFITLEIRALTDNNSVAPLHLLSTVASRQVIVP